MICNLVRHFDLDERSGNRFSRCFGRTARDQCPGLRLHFAPKILIGISIISFSGSVVTSVVKLACAGYIRLQLIAYRRATPIIEHKDQPGSVTGRAFGIVYVKRLSSTVGPARQGCPLARKSSRSCRTLSHRDLVGSYCTEILENIHRIIDGWAAQ